MSKIGFSTMFSYRPHVEVMYFLSKMFKEQGHEVFYLNCSTGLGNCYTQALREKNSKIKECSKCLAGSLYSYTGDNLTFVDNNKKSNLNNDKLNQMVASSCYTVKRIEDPTDKYSSEVNDLKKSLLTPVSIIYQNTQDWIKDNQLEYVFYFNGRMDLTRAVMTACLDNKIKCSSVERTVFGYGLQFNPSGSCLDLKHLHNIVKKYNDKPLTEFQASLSASLIVPRFRNEKNNEWRNYNLSEKSVDWPIISDDIKVLILPSSTNETMGHPDWESSWDSFPDAFEKIVNELGGRLSNVVLRAHPNWGENIGHSDGGRITKFYKCWCDEKNVHFISPSDTASTRSLMLEADYVLLTGSSAVFEASLLGKPSICVKKCHYYESGLSTFVLGENELHKVKELKSLKIDKKELVRKTLRFIYSYGIRYSQFAFEAKSISPTKYVFDKSLNVSKLLNMIDEDTLLESDEDFGESSNYENILIEKILKRQWEDLSFNGKLTSGKNEFVEVNRRSIFKLVKYIRDLLPRGDV